MSNPTWGTIPEAADRLQVSTRTIRRMITRGEIPARRIGARMIRVDLTALDSIGAPLQYTGGGAL
ncbi:MULTISPECIES: helix-turn-helix domain-containing protein [unclassified Microbacterium]|uniref:helix-turn-helix domain-containing protein n=1 Tax=unclassified Microbacterium TaxID=2609290 RepID=UPI000C5B324D|nr:MULTISPECIES: helix-turn-helix domain-containing protein [unclassified Microbacterium]MAN58063.1 DNA-binding protein [Paracoccus sp. (in: a-proteobacteria)]MAY50912.1 DNA-binding protein [Microbacterium sp.]|tara:strand:- start:76 stop:270 length:195 start_codon:yes stop_codon:yes gene_type:complete